MKKRYGLMLTLAAGLLLAGCGQSKGQSSANSSAKQATSKATKVSSSSAKKVAKQKTDKLNLAQLQKGNYASLAGQWTLIGTAVNYRNGTQSGYQSTGTGELKASATSLAGVGITMSGTKLTDDAGAHALKYQEKAGVLTAELADSAAINWAVSFYPKRSTTEFKTLTGTPTNEQNIIKVWTSNNSATWVFAQDISAATLKAMKGLDVEQLAANQFASLAGTWVNPTDGRKFVVTTKVATAPASMNLSESTGVELSGTESGGYPEVITAGPVTQGYIAASIGRFDPTVMVADMAPVAIVPKGVQMASGDDSDMTRDRLIYGAGQSGYASAAYYRQ